VIRCPGGATHVVRTVIVKQTRFDLDFGGLIFELSLFFIHPSCKAFVGVLALSKW